MKFKLLHLISLIFICAVFLCTAGQVSACLCPIQGPPRKDVVEMAKADATAVFMGEVISIDAVIVKDSIMSPLPDGTIEATLPQYERMVTFKVIDVWKGDVVSEIKMRAIDSGCDFPFEAGKVYLVYAYGKVLTTTLCSRTALVDTKNTRKEIKVLNKLKD